MARARQIPGISPEDPFAEVAARVVEARSGELFEDHGELLSLTDPEPVHDMRVAARRLRAALELFEPCFPRSRRRRAMRALGELADALGERRDRDVQIEWLTQRIAETSGGERGAAEDLLGALRVEREQANVALALALEELRHTRLQERLAKLAEKAGGGRSSSGGGSLRRGNSPAGGGSLRGGAREAISTLLERLYSHVPEALDEREVRALHRMRIAAKRLRYGLELTSFCFGPYAAQAAREARGLQNAIGAVHDRDVMIERLLAHGGMEVLIGVERERRGRLFAEFLERWAKLEREGFRERLASALAAPSGEHGEDEGA